MLTIFADIANLQIFGVTQQEGLEMESNFKGISRRGLLITGGVSAVALASGCAAGSTSTETTAAATAAAAAAASGSLPDGSKMKFYIISGNINDSFYDSVRQGMVEMDSIFGTTTQLTGTTDTNIPEIVATVRTIINQETTSGIMLPNLSEDAYQPLYDEAAAKGVPIVNYLVNAGAPRISYAGQDTDLNIAAKAADLIGEKIGGSGKVAVLGQISQPDLKARADEFGRVIVEKYPGIEFVGMQQAEASSADAVQKFDAIFAKDQDLKGLYYVDGGGGKVASQFKSRAPGVEILLTDIIEDNLNAVKSGDAFAAFGPSQFDLVFYGLQMLFWWNAGYRVMDFLIAGQPVITSETVDAFLGSPNSR